MVTRELDCQEGEKNKLEKQHENLIIRRKLVVGATISKILLIRHGKELPPPFRLRGLTG